MYCDFYQLRERPFNVTADPKFLYLNARYREALASLHYGISQRKGFITLIGEAGTGKTTLLKKLLDDLDATTRTVFIFNTNVSFDEILEYIFGEFDLPVHNGKRLYMLQRLNTFLLEELRNGRNVALLIDEAQDLDFAVLEDLRLLSNLETAKEKILQIVLSGQPELGQKLSNPGLRQLRQRVAVNCRLLPLTREEISEYIQSRLTAAGSTDPRLFTRDAEDRIYEISTGIPRLVNIVCDNALVIGYALGKKRIGADVVNEAAADLLSVEPQAPAPEPEPALPAPAVIESAPRSGWSVSQLGVVAVVVMAIVIGLLSVGRSLLRPRGPGGQEVASAPLEVVEPGSRFAEPAAPAVVPPASSARDAAAPPAPAVEDDRAADEQEPPASEDDPSAQGYGPQADPSADTSSAGLRSAGTSAGPVLRSPAEGGGLRSAGGAPQAEILADPDPPIAEGDRSEPDALAVEPREAPADAPRVQWRSAEDSAQVAALRNEPPPPAPPVAPAERRERAAERVVEERVVEERAPAAPVEADEEEAPPPAAAPAQPERRFETAHAVVPPPVVAPPPLPLPARVEEEAPQAAMQPRSESDVRLAQAKWESVMVKPGDSVSEIAIRNYGQASPTILDMMKIANPSIRDIDVISIGQELQLPQLDEGFVILRRDSGAYALLLLSTPHQQRANEIEGALRKHGFDARVGRADFGAGKMVSRVLIDSLGTRDEALSVGKRLQQLFREDENIAALAR